MSPLQYSLKRMAFHDDSQPDDGEFRFQKSMWEKHDTIFLLRTQWFSLVFNMHDHFFLILHGVRYSLQKYRSDTF